MLLIFANEADHKAKTLVESWRDYNARLLTIQDLSKPGWSHDKCQGKPSFVAEGEQINLDQVHGIFSRVRCVTEEDLGHIVEEDRLYVINEMTAFILDWLCRAPFTVLNRPTVGSLIGAAYSHERWLSLASKTGLKLNCSHKTYPPQDKKDWPSIIPVTVIGSRWFGDVDDELGQQAVKLAKAVPIELLTVMFDDADATASFVSADPMIDIEQPQIAEALLERLRKGVQ